MDEVAMTGEKSAALENIFLLTFCLIITLAGLGITAWVGATGRLLTLDGLLLSSICLLLAVVFGWNLAWSFHQGEVQKALKELLTSSKPDSE